MTIEEVQKQIDNINEEFKENAIGRQLDQFEFYSEDYRKLAEFKFRQEIRYNSDGDLVGKNGLPLSRYVELEMSGLKSTLCGPRGGSGQRQPSGPVPTLDDIKPGLTVEEYQRIGNHIKKFL